MLFDTWYTLDPGADECVLKGPKGTAKIRSLAGEDAAGQIWLGEDAMKRLYEEPRTFRAWHPFDNERPGRQSGQLIHLLLKEAGAFDRLMSPCVQVNTGLEITQEEKDLWKKAVLEAGGRKVRFVPRLQADDTRLVIQTGYAATEIGLFIGGTRTAAHRILFGGRSMDEAVQELTARKTRCLLHLEDARALRIAASDAMWHGKNPWLEVSGMNRYGQYETVRLRASQVWPAMESTIAQIVSWTGSVVEGAPLETREKFMKDGLVLRGCLSGCFGLPQTLVQTLGYPVRREEANA